MFLIARDKAEKETSKQSNEQKKVDECSEEDEDDRPVDHFDLESAQKLTAPPRGYTQSQKQRSSDDQKSGSVQYNDDDTLGDDLHDNPLFEGG